MYEFVSEAPVDPYADWEPQTICSPNEKTGVMAFRSWVMKGLGGTDLGIVRECDIGGSSHHKEGRAWDWGPSDPGHADGFVDCLTRPDENGEPDALARRAGLRYVIWKRRIWVADGKGWRPYKGVSPHTDHVHFSFSWDGALAKTSLYSFLEDGTAVAEADVDLTSEPPKGGHQIAAVRTPLEPEELAKVLSEGHRQIFGSRPNYNRLGMAWAMVNHETARTKSAWHHNWGNIMRTPSWKGNFHALKVGPGEPVFYRSYETPVDGAMGYWSLLKLRYPEAIDQFDTGDAHASAQALKSGGWYQAPAQLYGNAMSFFFNEWKKSFDSDRAQEMGLAILISGALAATATLLEKA